MTAARWHELKSILADAVECGSDHERERLIAAACGAQADLAAELISFLRYAKETADEQWLGGHFASGDLKASPRAVSAGPRCMAGFSRQVELVIISALTDAKERPADWHFCRTVISAPVAVIR